MPKKPAARPKNTSNKQLSAEERNPPDETGDQLSRSGSEDNQQPEGYLQKLARLTREAEEKIQAREAEEQEYEDTKRRGREIARKWRSNKLIQTRAAAVEADMIRLEGEGLFASFPIKQTNRFPSLLTRLPLFRATHRKKQQAMSDVDNTLSFDTPFGSGRRRGPTLTTWDEDVLMAIMRQRSRRLLGKPESLPAKVEDIYKKNEFGSVGVHCAFCSVTDILKELEIADAGDNRKNVLESVKRLATTSIELNLTKHERYLGLVETGRMIPLMHVQWQTWETDGLLFVIFPPVIAHWLDSEYTYIDWTVRRQLMPLGKCIHRFLSGQNIEYSRNLKEMGEIVGYDGPAKNIRTRFRKALDQMVEVGWLDGFEFQGSAKQGNGLTLRTFRTLKSKKKKLQNSLK